MLGNNKGKMFSARVCLIVDNPLRDLDGLVLLAWQLAQKNAEVFLVSMSHMDEVYLLKPDLVLVNYVRKPNKLFIDSCASLGILIGVLDTEGGILQDVDTYFGNVFKYTDQVDLYCLWGRKQFNALHKRNIFSEDSLKITGCPRYDFCVHPWQDALPEVPISNKKTVLINTNFQLAHPRFQSIEKEIKELITSEGLEEKYAYGLVSQTKIALDEVVRVVKYLAPRFPELTFVIRPHPFEDNTLYEQLLIGFDNVEVHQSGPVFPWIKNSLVLLHHNCSTAVEAILLGKEPIYMGWIKAPLLEQPASIEVSQYAHSLDELECMLKRVLNGHGLEVSEQKKNIRKKVISDWFYLSDGKGAERVGDAILETIGNAKKRKNISKYDYVNVLLLNSLLRGDLKSFLKQVIFFILGGHNYSELKRMVYKTGKEFSISDVRSIVEGIAKVVNTPNNITLDFINDNRFVKNLIRLAVH